MHCIIFILLYGMNFMTCLLLRLIYFHACFCLRGLVYDSMHGSLPEKGDSVLEDPSSIELHIHRHTITSHQHTDPGTDI